jgi:very-short-patch-repair endonuclease
MPTVKAVLEDKLQMYAQAGWSAHDIAKELDCAAVTVQRYARDWGIKLAKEKSLGALVLQAELEKMFPGFRIEAEYGIGERLRLDFYIPDLKVAFEFNGTQHYTYTPAFHTDEDGYRESISRDARKQELCSQAGILLIVVDKDHPLDQDLKDRLLSREIPETKGPVKKSSRPAFHTSPEYLAKQRQYRKAAYQRAKEAKKLYASR